MRPRQIDTRALSASLELWAGHRTAGLAEPARYGRSPREPGVLGRGVPFEAATEFVAYPPNDARSPFSPARRLFDTQLAVPSPSIEQYAASADGQRFLVLKPLDDKVRNSVGVILNWPELLQHRQ
jgi:hypothetical protein